MSRFVFLFLILLTMMACKSNKQNMSNMSADWMAFTPTDYGRYHDTVTNYYSTEIDTLIPEITICVQHLKKQKKRLPKITQDTTDHKDIRPLNQLALAAGVSFYSGLSLSSICAWLGISLLSLTLVSGVLVIAGIILALIAIKKIKANQFQERGYGLAKSVIAIFSFLMFFAVMAALALIQALR